MFSNLMLHMQLEDQNIIYYNFLKTPKNQTITKISINQKVTKIPLTKKYSNTFILKNIIFFFTLERAETNIIKPQTIECGSLTCSIQGGTHLGLWDPLYVLNFYQDESLQIFSPFLRMGICHHKQFIITSKITQLKSKRFRKWYLSSEVTINKLVVD